jgi:hypothetical protein
LTNVPPKVLSIAVAYMKVELVHKRRGRICTSEIVHESGVSFLREEGQVVWNDIE